MQGLCFTDTSLTGVEDQKTNKDQTTKFDIKKGKYVSQNKPWLP